jgi:hypothetical protein
MPVEQAPLRRAQPSSDDSGSRKMKGSAFRKPAELTEVMVIRSAHPEQETVDTVYDNLDFSTGLLFFSNLTRRLPPAIRCGLCR